MRGVPKKVGADLASSQDHRSCGAAHEVQFEGAMARIFFAWELGSGLNHIDTAFRLGDCLEAHGHQTIYAVRDLPKAQRRGGARSLRLYQAPFAFDPWRSQTPSVNFADVLLNCGYADADGLRGLINGWLGLFRSLNVDLVVAEHAPTAILAARIAGLPSVALGIGFQVPPPSQPTPSIQPWREVPLLDLDRADSCALTTINAVLRWFGATPLRCVAELFDLPEVFLCTFPEVDHYDRPLGTAYYGNQPCAAGATSESWASMAPPRLVAYLSASHPGCSAIVEALAASALPALVYIGDGSAGMSSIAWQSGAPPPRVEVAAEPINLRWALPRANAVLCHGGTGTIVPALLAGLPIIAVPMHVEQGMVSLRLARRNFGVAVFGRELEPAIPRAIAHALASTQIAAAVNSFANRYRGFDPVAATEAMRLCCEDNVLVNGAPRPKK